MASNQPGLVFVKSGQAFKGSLWALVSPGVYLPVNSIRVRLQLSVAGALSGLYLIDGITPIAGDLILVTQGAPATDGLYLANGSAWTLVALVAALSDGFQINVFDGSSAPAVYVAQG